MATLSHIIVFIKLLVGSHNCIPLSLLVSCISASGRKKRMEITTRYIKEIETDVFLWGSSPNIYAIMQDIKDEPL